MRITRYLWISNLPQCATEQDIRDILQSHGKIQSVRIHSDEVSHGAVVAFVDTQSATRAVQSTVRFKKIVLSLQYCESSGVPGSNCQESVIASGESSKTDSSSVSHPEVQQSCERLVVTDFEEVNSSLISLDRRKYSCSHHTDSRSMTSSMESNTTAGGRHSVKQRGLYVQRLPLRSSDTNLREGLFHEYKKHGKITSVVIRGQAEGRYCIITFKRNEDASRALDASKGKVFFGTPISVTMHDGIDVEDPDLCPPEHALDEYHPKATKTLFVGNLCSNTVTQDELRKTFRTYGEIIEIDIKIQANQPDTSYAFVQYSDIRSVVRALSHQDTIRVGGKVVKLGFGKSQPTNVVWLDNLPCVTEALLTRQFGRYGHLTHVVLDRKSSRALLYFDTVEMAQRALNETRNRAILGRKVHLDYAGYECQVAFMRRLGKNDCFGQAYDDYRERLQELLSLWPSYGLPLFGRQKYFEEPTMDDQGDNLTPCYDRRSSKKRLSSTDRFVSGDHSVTYSKSDLDSPRGRLHSKKTSMASNVSGSHNRRTDRGLSKDTSTSPLGDSRTKLRLSGDGVLGRSTTHKSFESQGRPNITDECSLLESARGHPIHQTPSAYSDAKCRSHRFPTSTQMCKDTTHRPNSTRTSVKGSHYLDETDEVSSDSLSSDFGGNEVVPESLYSKHNCNQDRIPQKGANTKGSIFDSFVDGTQLLSPSSLRKYVKSHIRDSSAPFDSPSRFHRSLACDSLSPKSTNSKKHSQFHDADAKVSCYTARTHPRGIAVNSSNSRQSIALDEMDVHRSRLSKTTDLYSESGHFNKERVNSNKLPSHTNEQSYCALLNRSSKSDERGSQQFIQLPDSSIESQDTLTKLEQERAKLLRELSVLNNEVVVGSKSKLSSASSRKRSSRVSEMNGEHRPKVRHTEPAAFHDLHGDPLQPTVASQSLSLVDSRITTQPICRVPETLRPSDSCKSRHSAALHSESNQSFDGCYNSNSKAVDLLSPVVTERLASPFAGELTFSANDTSIPPSLKEEKFSPTIASTVSSSFYHTDMLSLTSQNLLPPPPTSPLTRLSSPASPLTASTDFMDSVSLTSQPMGSLPISISSRPGLPVIRDPRLVAHPGSIDVDVPPPPPFPDHLKTPLWVDASARASSLSTKPPPVVASVTVHSTALEEDSFQGCDVVSASELQKNSLRVKSCCSLDERIRLLDAQLLKSEKARPIVDYSKFRIRRKIEAASSDIPCPTTCSDNSMTPLTSPIVMITESSRPTAPSLVSCSRPQMERITCSERNIFSIPISSVVSSTSPIAPISSPLSTLRPADTSEFVKSMLSASKPSPSASVADQSFISPPSDSTCLRSSHTRLPTNSPPMRPMIDVNGRHMCTVTLNQPLSVNPSTRNFTVFNSQHIPSHNTSTNGIQPIGVATRLPFVPFSPAQCISTDKTLSVHINSSESIIQPVKSILKKEISTDHFNRALLDLSAAYSNEKSCRIDSRPTESFKSGAEDSKPVDGNLFKTSVRRQADFSEVLNSCEHSSPRESQKLTQITGLPADQTRVCAPHVKLSTTTKPRASKSDIPRPALDDSIFTATLKRSGAKTKRARQDSDGCSRKQNIRSGGISQICINKPMRTKEDAATVISTQAGIKSVDRRVSNLKKPQHVGVASKHGNLQSTNISKTRLDKTKKTESQTGISSATTPTTTETNSKRKMRVDPENSGLDFPVRQSTSPASTSSKITGLSEMGYESMYDKIKRRANKVAVKVTESLDKSEESNKMPIKRSSKRIPSKKRTGSTQSLLCDSDTDECLSDASVTTENKHDMTRKVLGSKRRSMFASVQSTTRSNRKKKWSLTNENVNAHATSTKKDKRLLAPDQCILITDHLSNPEVRRSASSKTNRHLKGNSAPLVVDSTGDSKRWKRSVGSSVTTNFSSSLAPRKKRPSSVFLQERRRSLVHRVFASTDSESPSSDSDGSARNSSKPSGKASVQGQSVSSYHSDSTSPRASRSCSPEDLRADAAIRHTFGAFALPSGMIHSKDKKGGFTAVKPVTSSDNPCSIKSPDDQTTNISKSTPPTLPMLDSSPSTDHSFSTGEKCRTRDSTDWNIFTSLTNQSTPKRDLNGVSSSASTCPTESGRISTGLVDFDDELPSLEKHDEDDSRRIENDSILLDDNSDSHRCNKNTASNDDLPPPVVSALDDLSPLSVIDSEVVTSKITAPQSDVIEEIVYDTMELQLPFSEHPLSSSSQASPRKSELPEIEMVVTANTCEDEENCQHRVTPDVSLPSTVNDAVWHTDVKLSTVDSPVVSGSNSAVSFPSVSLHSMFAPITVLASNTQPNNLSAVGQPVLVTVPRPATGGSLSSTSLTLLPASFPSGSQTSNSGNQRHVALLLPATPVSSILSVQSNPTASVHNTPTVVYNASVPTTNGASVCVMPAQNAITNIYMRRNESDSPCSSDKTCAASVIKLPLVTEGSVTAGFLSNSTESHVSGAYPLSLPPVTSIAFDPSDFTSYVQRVIERVKQEKDEEVLHQREKVRRPKRVSTTNIPILSTSAVSVTCSVFIPTSIITSSVASLPPIAPMPTTSNHSACAKSPLVSLVVDGHLSVPIAAKQVEARVRTKHDLSCNSSVVESLQEKSDISHPADCTTAVLDCQNDECIESVVSLAPLRCEASNSNTVDEVIDAVVNGQFNETDYLKKMVKALADFAPSSCASTAFSPIATDVTSSDSPLLGEKTKPSGMPAEEHDLGSHPPTDASDTPKLSAVGTTVRNTEDSMCSSPSRVFTPMHVLTLVASGSTSSQPVSTQTAISPGVISQTPGLSGSQTSHSTTPVTTHVSINNATDLSLADGCKSKYFPALDTVSSVSSATASSPIEHLAAQFASYPLTNYFYSLFAQHRLQTSPNPTSSESTIIKSDDISLTTRTSTTFQPKFDGTSVSSCPSSNDTAEFFAAVATMAAMSSPSGMGRMGSQESRVTITNTSMCGLTSSSGSFSTQPWSLPLEIQGFPVAWQGRLSLKNEETFVQMHYLSGNRELLKDCMNVTHEQNSISADLDSAIAQPLKIVQRMRLEPSQLDGVHRKLRQTSDFCMCLTLATASPLTNETAVASEKAHMNHILADVFIKYLVDKCAAGIINVCHPCTQQNLYVIHIFPPCDFSRNQLESIAPNLLHQLTRYSTPYLLVVITTV